jgi:hypothetical protein
MAWRCVRVREERKGIERAEGSNRRARRASGRARRVGGMGGAVACE